MYNVQCNIIYNVQCNIMSNVQYTMYSNVHVSTNSSQFQRKIFPKMSSLLYKTLLMSDPQGRVLDNATENQLVSELFMFIDDDF